MHAATRAPMTRPVALRPTASRTRRTLQETTGRIAGWFLVRVMGVDQVLGI